jgi:hypothetical protein
MARTTFSGPVRAGYQGGNADPQNPVTPTTINAGEVIEVDQGTGAYGFYSRVEPTVGFGSSTFQTPGEAYGMFGRVQTGAPFATLPSTTFNHMAGVVGNFAVIGTYSNNGLMAGVMGIINTNTLSGDAAVMAFMAGDSGVTTCRAAFGVAMAQTTPGSGFEFGIDLKMQDQFLTVAVLLPSSLTPRLTSVWKTMLWSWLTQVLRLTAPRVITLLARVLCMLIRLLVCSTSTLAQSATQLGWLSEPSPNVDS